MADISVYVPDGMKERIDAADLPRGMLSQLARDAWTQHLEWIAEVEEMEEIQVDARELDGTEVELRFTGEEIARNFYLTEDGNVVLLDEDDTYAGWTAEQIDRDPEA